MTNNTYYKSSRLVSLCSKCRGNRPFVRIEDRVYDAVDMHCVLHRGALHLARVVRHSDIVIQEWYSNTYYICIL